MLWGPSGLYLAITHFLANLTQSTHPLFCSKDQPTTTPKAVRLKGPASSAAAVMMFKSKRPYFLTFYVKDNRLHLLLPMVFFLGLFEAFMSKNFLMVSISIFFIPSFWRKELEVVVNQYKPKYFLLEFVTIIILAIAFTTFDCNFALYAVKSDNT